MSGVCSTRTIKVLLALAGVSFPLIIAEICLRVLAPHLILTTSGQATLRLDDSLGWRPIEQEKTFSAGVGEGRRIHFMGDSFTDFDDKWPVATLHLLRQRGEQFSGTVGGVAGYGTYQEYLKLQEDLPVYRPDLTILLVYLWNDLRDNSAFPPIYYNLSTSRRPYLVRDSEGGFVHVPTHLPRPWYRHLAITAAGSRAFEELYTQYIGDVDVLARSRSQLPIDYSNPFTWREFYRPGEAGEYVTNAWTVTEEALRLIRDLTHKYGSSLCVLGLDNAFTVDEDVWRTHGSPRLDIRAPLDRLGEVTKRLGIRYFDLQPHLVKARAALGKKIYNGPEGNLSGHLEAEGEDVVAQVAAGCVP